MVLTLPRTVDHLGTVHTRALATATLAVQLLCRQGLPEIPSLRIKSILGENPIVAIARDLLLGKLETQAMATSKATEILALRQRLFPELSRILLSGES